MDVWDLNGRDGHWLRFLCDVVNQPSKDWDFTLDCDVKILQILTISIFVFRIRWSNSILLKILHLFQNQRFVTQKIFSSSWMCINHMNRYNLITTSSNRYYFLENLWFGTFFFWLFRTFIDNLDLTFFIDQNRLPSIDHLWSFCGAWSCRILRICIRAWSAWYSNSLTERIYIGWLWFNLR